MAVLRHLKAPSSKAFHLGKTDGNQQIKVTVVVRRRPGHDPIPSFESFLGCPPRTRLSEEEFAQRYGASEDDVNAIKSHYSLFELESDHHMCRRHVYLTGTVAQFNSAFGVELQDYEKSHGKEKVRFRSHAASISVPDHIFPAVVEIINFENQPLSPPPPPPPVTGIPNNTVNLTPTILKNLYNFPNVSAAGQTIAIGALPGWGMYTNADLQTTCTHWGVPFPNIQKVILDSSVNIGNSFEGPMDVSLCAILAPGANIVVYVDHSIPTMVASIVHPGPGQPVCTIMSLSMCLQDTNQPSDAAFEDAAIQGMTCFASSGDWGTTDAGGNVVALWPCCSPWVVGAGGTTLGTNSGTISTSNFLEWLWNENSYYQVTGGGVSVVFPQPSYQAGFNIPASITTLGPGTLNGAPGKGSPDISMSADGNSGIPIYMGAPYNAFLPSGGTSASAPELASMFACINSALGRNVGFINSTLYTVANNPNIIRKISPGGPTSNAFTDTTSTHPGDYPGYPLNINGWSANVGLGMVNASNFLAYVAKAEIISVVGMTLNPHILPAGAPAGTTIGQVAVQATGVQNYTFSLSGPYAPFLSITGNTLTSTAVFTSPSAFYNVNILAAPTFSAIPPLTSITDTAGAVWTVVAGIALRNGVNVGTFGSSGVILLLLYGGVIYQENGSNQWFSWIGDWAAVSGDPRVGFTETVFFTVPEPALTGIALSNATVASGSVSGTVIGAITVQATGGAFSGTLSIGGANANLFQMVGTNLCTSGNITTGTYNITIIATEAATNTTFTAPFVITSPQIAPGVFTGTLSLSGPDAALFSISGTNLVTASTISPGRTYSVNIIATQTGLTGSPFTQPETITTTGTVTITGITFSNSNPSFTGAVPVGTVVTTIGVTIQ